MSEVPAAKEPRGREWADEGSRGREARPEAVLGLRRPAELADRPPPGDDPVLLERIRSEIRRTGPLPFARFMELALYAPGHGYYATGRRGPGRSGDFLTAPEAHPIFGWAIARQLEEVWDRLGRPDPFTVREHGAGSGALAAGIVEGLARTGSPLRGALRYRVVERGRGRRRQVLDRLAALDAAAVLEPDDGAPIVGAVLANEVLDALAVHRVVETPSGLAELFVDLDRGGRLVTVEGPPSTPALAARLADEGVVLAPGQRAEVCLALDAWVRDAGRGLRAGLLLVIDYGHDAHALYTPDRGSLLRAYTGHRVHDEVLENVGRQDLTAHVDLTAVERAAAGCGLVHLGTTSQAELLAGLGIGELLAELGSRPGVDVAGALAARSAVVRLLDPRATGGFAAVLFGRGIDPEPPLRGLSIRLARPR